MVEKFKFKLSKDIAINEHDASIVFFAELNDDGYKVTWSDETYPMSDENGTSYTIEQADSAIKDGHWILLD